jgi:Rab5 GDP/GTP exchange factor
LSSPLSAEGGGGGVGGVSRTPTPHLDIVGMQEEINRVHENVAVAKETLWQMFLSMNLEIVE